MIDAAAPSLRDSWLTFPRVDRIIRGLLLVFIFSLPFKGLLFLERNGFLVLLILLGLWCLATRRHFLLPTPVDRPLAAFVLWVGFTIPFATYPEYSLKEYGKLLQQGLVFYAVVFFFRERIQWRRVVWLVLGLFLIVVANGLVRFEDTVRGGGSFLRAEVWLTTYLVMMLPLCFALAWYEDKPWLKVLWAVGTGCGTACLFLTQSRAGLVAFVVEVWAFAWLLKRRTMVLGAGAVTAILLVVLSLLVKVTVTPEGSMMIVPRVSLPIKTSTSSFVHRWDIWTFALQRIAEHPLVGIGYGKETSKMLYGQIPEEAVAPGHAPIRSHGTHNILLEVALLVGIPGLLLFLWLGIRAIRTVVEGFRHADDPFSKAVLLGVSVGTIGLAVRIQFDQMFVGTLALQWWILLAVAVLASRSFVEDTTGARLVGEQVRSSV